MEEENEALHQGEAEVTTEPVAAAAADASSHGQSVG